MTEEHEGTEELRNFPQGRAIKQLRAFLGKNQDDIAALAGVSKAAVSLWEREKVSSIQYDTIKRLVEAVGLSMDDFNQFTETNDERYIASARWPAKEVPTREWAPTPLDQMVLRHPDRLTKMAAAGIALHPRARTAPASVAHIVDRMVSQDARATENFRVAEDPTTDHLRRLMQAIRTAITDASSIGSRFDAVFARGYSSLLVALAGLSNLDVIRTGRRYGHWHGVDIPGAPCSIMLSGAASSDPAREAHVKAFAQPLNAPVLTGPVFLQIRRGDDAEYAVVLDLTTRTPSSLVGFAYHLFAETLRIGRALLDDGAEVAMVVIAPAIDEFAMRRVAMRGSARPPYGDAVKLADEMRGELDRVLLDGRELVSHFGWSMSVVEDFSELTSFLADKIGVPVPPTAMQVFAIESGEEPFDENDPAWGKSW